MRIPLPALKIISNIGKIISGKVIFPDDFFDMVALNWRFSSQKAREQLGWEPHTFAEGIAETWAEYREIRKK